VRGKKIVILGRNDDAVEYALAMMAYSPKVMIATNAEAIVWDDDHAAWVAQHQIPVLEGRIVAIEHVDREIQALCFEGDRRVAADVAFTTRGDVYHNHLALTLGAEIDDEGQVLVDHQGQTTVPGLYAAGCLTPANCQAIVAAGQGTIAAQAINRAIFEEDLLLGRLKRFREVQIARGDTLPEVLG
jgi:thioredoxin reductase (NADPH)